MRFEILGPMRVSGRGREIAVRAGRDRALLAMLVLHANRSVPVADLVEALWADTAPKHARGQLQGCVSRLRKQFASIGLNNEFITTEPEGYRLLAGSVTVDLLEFRRFVAKARVAARAERPGEARDAYRAALALWRGPALADIDRGTVRQAAASLDEEHTQALEECIDLDLTLGGAGELVGELTELVRQHPYRERLHAALMLALYRADRQADALAAYQRIRQLLVTELGQEPGPALRDLHQRILTGDESLRRSDLDRRAQDSDPQPAKRHLPRTINDFTGRAADLAWLTKVASQADPYAPLVVTIDGMPGVGKTSLAVRAAHMLESRFPDGQLFIDLHGHSTQRPALEPAGALSTLLRQLSIPATQIAPDLDERIAQWRAELASRRAVVVLDNAASTAQISPLLPASAGCFVLITSRRRLLDLDGTRPLSVSTLDPEEAVALLERIVGPRVAAEPDAAAEVTKHCGYLPLALRLAGARLAHRPRWRVEDLADRLADRHVSLVDLTAGDRTVADTFALSYDHLSRDGQRLFRLLGLHSGDQFDISVAAALAAVELGEAQPLLDELVDAHLIEEPGIRRYRLHDLVKTFAFELTHATDPANERFAAVERVLDYYVHAAASACTSLYPDRRLVGLQLGEPQRPDLLLNHHEWGETWLEIERPNLTASVHQAANHGHHRYTWQLAGAMWRFLYHRGYLDDLVDTHKLGLAAAEHADDAAATATMHNYLASAYYQDGRCRDAIPHLRSALAQRQRSNDQVGETSIRRNLALVCGQAGLHREAIDECERALATAVKSGDRTALALVLVNAGDLHLTLGRYATALSYSRRGLALCREIGSGQDIATALGNIGRSRARLGESVAALRLLKVALKARRRTHDRWGEAEAHKELGMIYRSLGDFGSAMKHHQEALAVVTDTGFRHEEYSIYSELGRTLLAQGDTAAALEMQQRALAGTTKIRHKYGQARALDGIAACLHETDPESARQHWLRALRLYQELDAPERHDLEHHLATLAG